MTATGRVTRLLLVRHGQIDANLTRVWHGSTDSPLTELGRRQAHAVAHYLARTRPGAAALYTSTLERSLHTAEAIGSALGLDPRADPDLVEFGIGALEGVSYGALLRKHRFFERILLDQDFAPPGGESVRDVIARVTRAFRRIAEGHPGQEVIAVGHGAATGLALAQLLEGDPGQWPRYQVSNCSISEFVLEPEPRLLSLGESAHLGAD